MDKIKYNNILHLLFFWGYSIVICVLLMIVWLCILAASIWVIYLAAVSAAQSQYLKMALWIIVDLMIILGIIIFIIWRMKFEAYDKTQGGFV
jgi:hypothetical protein